MHFWIDKRSQACSFGRARVSASLSGSSLAFGHPRRIRGKSMVTPIHRFPTLDASRPHPYRNHQQHHQQQSQQHHNAVVQYHQSSSYNNNQQSSQQSTNYHVPLNQVNSNAHEIEVDNSTIGIGTLSSGQHHVSHHQSTQLLPTHLKCGMWASLALATIFVASAKFYFDHQGTGLEVLIFCAFLATFFLTACTVSLFKRPRDITNNVEHLIESVAHESIASQTNQETLPTNTQQVISCTNVQQTQELAPPPPYHIAILLPENAKESDETPPPSYDKILIIQ